MKHPVTLFARIWTTAWKTALFFVLWGILLAPFVVPFSTKFSSIQQTHPLGLRLFHEFSGAITILAVSWFMAHFIDRRSFRTLGFSTEHWVRDLLLGFSIGACWLAISVAIVWLARLGDRRCLWSGRWHRSHPDHAPMHCGAAHLIPCAMDAPRKTRRSTALMIHCDVAGRSPDSALSIRN
jgi:hypothetical protein